MTTALFLHFDPTKFFLLFGAVAGVPVVVAAARYIRTVFQ